MEEFPEKDLAAGLPGPRKDEPASLRQDIVDELADHLHCAVARERLNDQSGAGTGNNALQSAISRFGDPAAVARRLWWDQMKERIMTQRILAGAAALLIAASIVYGVFFLQALKQSINDQREAFDVQREVSREMLAELKALREDGKSQANNDWHPLRIKLVGDNSEPVKGQILCVGMMSGGQQSSGNFSQQIWTDEAGVADFGPLPTGHYGVCVTLPDFRAMRNQIQVFLGPGRQTEYTVACPTNEMYARPLEFEIAPPDDLANENLYYLADVHWTGWKLHPHWTFMVSDGIGMNQMHKMLLLDSHGKIIGDASYALTWPTLAERTTDVACNIGNAIAGDYPLSEAENYPPGFYTVAIVLLLAGETGLAGGQLTGTQIPSQNAYAAAPPAYGAASGYAPPSYTPPYPAAPVGSVKVRDKLGIPGLVRLESVESTHHFEIPIAEHWALDRTAEQFWSQVREALKKAKSPPAAAAKPEDSARSSARYWLLSDR